MLEKFKSLLANDALFYSVFLTLIALASFGLGRQSVESKLPPTSVLASEPSPLAPKSDLTVTEIETLTTTVVASKSGTKYHLPTCPGAKQIKESNKISFKSIIEAEAAGYTPAANCKF